MTIFSSLPSFFDGYCVKSVPNFCLVVWGSSELKERAENFDFFLFCTFPLLTYWCAQDGVGLYFSLLLRRVKSIFHGRRRLPTLNLFIQSSPLILGVWETLCDSLRLTIVCVPVSCPSPLYNLTAVSVWWEMKKRIILEISNCSIVSVWSRKVRQFSGQKFHQSLSRQLTTYCESSFTLRYLFSQLKHRWKKLRARGSQLYLVLCPKSL